MVAASASSPTTFGIGLPSTAIGRLAAGLEPIFEFGDVDAFDDIGLAFPQSFGRIDRPDEMRPAVARIVGHHAARALRAREPVVFRMRQKRIRLVQPARLWNRLFRHRSARAAHSRLMQLHALVRRCAIVVRIH